MKTSWMWTLQVLSNSNTPMVVLHMLQRGCIGAKPLNKSRLDKV